ncbi:hypothetical protein SDC9_90400 [bioreactor metagenome]|uniref:Uncharacterized protein n=1 Tax=bioreactor metagenome TaxID=1076179 RepID=A0A644ZYM5_9ZZZZ
MGEVLLAEVDNLPRRGMGPLVEPDEGLGHFAVHRVGNAYDHGLGNRRVGVEDGLYLLGVDVETADDDDIRHPVENPDIPVFHPDVVPGVEPAVRETVRRHDGIPEVAGGDGRPLHPEHPFARGGHILVLVVEELPLVPPHYGSHGAETTVLVVPVHRHHGRTLGDAVSFDDRCPEDLLGLAVKLHVQPVSPGDGHLQARWFRGALAHGDDHEVEHGGNRQDDIGPRRVDGFHGFDGGEERGEEGLPEFFHQGHEAAHGVAEGMEVRQHVEEGIPFLEELKGFVHPHGVVQQVAVGEGNGLGHSRGPGCGEDHRQ